MAEFPAWSPDLYLADSGLAGEALNVLPGQNSYVPWPSFAELSDAVPATVLSSATVRGTDGTFVTFVIASNGRAYKFAGIGSPWTNVTRAVGGDYTIPANERPTWALFGDQLILVIGGEPPQVIDVDSGTNFADLAGTPPEAHIVRVVGDFVMIGDVEAVSRRHLQWSGRNVHDFWTLGKQSADGQTFPDGGNIKNFVALLAKPLTFIILQEDIVRIGWETSDGSVFNFAPISQSEGTIAPHSPIAHNSTALYYGKSGFVSQVPSTVTPPVPIGKDWIDGWFKELAEESMIPMMVGCRDPRRKRYFWSFNTSGNTTNYQNHVLCFEPDSKHPWTHGELTSSFLFNSATPGLTLDVDGEPPDELLDSDAPSLDSPIYAGGSSQVGAFTSANKLAFMSGPNLAATVQDSPLQPIPGKRAYVNGFRPLTDAANARGRIGVSERAQVPIAWGAQSSISRDGAIYGRAGGRFMQREVTIPAAEEWTHLGGLEWLANEPRMDGQS